MPGQCCHPSATQCRIQPEVSTAHTQPLGKPSILFALWLDWLCVDGGGRCIPSLGGGQGYGAEAEDTWLIADPSDVALLAQAQCRTPVDTVGTAPWMQT